MEEKRISANPWALAPLGIFLITYVVISLLAGDFYKIPITVAFVLGCVVAVAMSRGSLSERVEQFCKGPANPNIMLMVLIFILAGAFAQTTKTMGAVDSTVNFTLWLLPGKLIVPGLFLAACFISVSMGTSVGTIVALTPIAAGLADKTGLTPALLVAAVVSGAMFGDNLSFISDTTIVATRTQGCRMKDKFRTNLRIVWPFAVLSMLLYFVIGAHNGALTYEIGPINWLHVLPYLAVFVAALCGVNVILVLLGGTLLAGAIGLATRAFHVWGWTGAMGAGINGMSELIIVTLLAGGMLEMIRLNGGFAWMIEKMTARTHSVRGAELSIAGLVSLANLCTANNTIALIMAGPIAKEIATRFKIPANRSASLLDIFSCFVQGIIPYGAQLLMAAGLAVLSPLSIMQYLYYPYLLGLGALCAIWLGYPRRGPRNK